MRLIDADAFSEEMKRRQNACEKWMHNAEMLNDEDMIARANGAWSVFIETKLTLDKQPTVSPDMAQVLAYECGKAERKKGKWENKQIDFVFFDKDAVVCSECKDINGIAFTKDFAVKHFRFCPFCGAEMRGEANNV